MSGSLILGKARSFRMDAVRCMRGISPAPVVRGKEHIPSHGPFLLTVNHYSRPGFNAAWIALASSAAVPVELHWITTSAWTFPGRRLAQPFRKISELALGRLAQIYGFTSMPPMPPAPQEAQRRAQAVKRVLDYAKNSHAPVIGLAPEGRDHSGGVLGSPPPGAGRFVSLLAARCCWISPVGIFEEDGQMVVQFGPVYAPDLPMPGDRDQQDLHISRIVMTAIAAQLPPHLRGEYQ